MLQFDGIGQRFAESIQFGFVKEEPLHADTGYGFADVVYLAPREGKRCVGLRQTHLIGERQEMTHRRVVGLHLHRLYPLAP